MVPQRCFFLITGPIIGSTAQKTSTVPQRLFPSSARTTHPRWAESGARMSQMLFATQVQAHHRHFGVVRSIIYLANSPIAFTKAALGTPATQNRSTRHHSIRFVRRWMVVLHTDSTTLHSHQLVVQHARVQRIRPFWNAKQIPRLSARLPLVRQTQALAKDTSGLCA